GEHANREVDADDVSPGRPERVDVPSVAAADVADRTAVERRQQLERFALQVDARLLEVVEARPRRETRGIRVRDVPEITGIGASGHHERTTVGVAATVRVVASYHERGDRGS